MVRPKLPPAFIPKSRSTSSSDNRHIDLIAEGFDLALRVSKTPSPSLIVKPLAKIEFVLLAAPDYLPDTAYPIHLKPSCSTKPSCLPIPVNKTGKLPTATPEKKAILHLSPVIRSDNTLMIRELIKAGAGIGYQPLWAVQQELKDGTLIQLLPDYTIWTDQLNATYVDRAFLSAKVRSFIDFLNEKISER